jgi:hypothetical protein
MIYLEDPGSWVAQAEVAKALTHVSQHALREWLSQNGWASGVRVRCFFKGYRPPNTGQSGWQTAARLVCRIRQYVTAP